MLAGAALGGGWEARHRLHQWYMQETGACVAGPSPPEAHVRIVTGSLRSSSVPGAVGYVVALPQPERPPASTPVVFCLPGRATTATGVLDLGLAGFAAQAAGGAAPALVGVDSGESYWHPRRSGEDRMAMLIHDLLPMVERRFGLGPGGRSILGWSMGGYGALLAAALHLFQAGCHDDGFWRLAAGPALRFLAAGR